MKLKRDPEKNSRYTSITKKEKQMIDDVVEQVKQSMLRRCKKMGCTETEKNGSVYHIQDYLTNLDVIYEVDEEKWKKEKGIK